MIKMMKKQSDKTLSEQEIKDWGEYQRKRDLSPSIYNQRVFRRQHPNDNQDYIFEMKEGKELLIEVLSR